MDKVRQVCLRFQKSAVLHDTLIDSAAELHGTKTKIVCDVRTRWCSTLRMLRNFVNLEESLRSFYSTEAKAFPLSVADMVAVEEIISVLTHTECCIKRLSKSTATMRDADIAIQVGETRYDL